MSEKHNPDIGKQISDTVRTALESGDLSRLKEIGPTVQNAVRDTLSSASQPTHTPANNTEKPPRHTYPQGGQATPHGYTPQPGKTPSPATTQQTPGWYSKSGSLRPTLPRSGYGVGSIVLGVMGMVAFGLTSLLLAVAGLAAGALGGMLYWIVGMLAPFALSAGLLGGGVGKRGLLKRLRRYMSLFGDKNVLTIEEISTITGRSEAAVRRDIHKGIDKKVLRGIRMDVMETCIIRGEEAYRLYLETEEARKQREAEQAERERRLQDPKTAPIEVFREEGRTALRKIREVAKVIPGAQIRDKLEKLENTTGRIFAYVETHPEKLPDTRKFMNYYLPTTLKLVEKYRQYEEMNVQMDNVLKAKADIARSLDTIDLAFNNLLESLYHEDTLDVSTDIEVLETMLEQEGLTGKKFEIDNE
ncbi:5-bromo-4-chloroindolyl phosphate hydrolysis family protein [Ruminococcaceae bacterium OttesenSCG-928-I18]|nr:5-bromo-4-chloroindolyl phosphate hydrolysis family protein [Ruminococcaceae bacterium OttesenSCG-928-I18]